MNVWDDFIERSGPRPPPLTIAPKGSSSDRVAVVVEPRNHPHLVYVVRNVMHFLGPDWKLRIYHGNQNLELVNEAIGDADATLVPLEVDNLTKVEYNQLMCQASFWESIPEENILVFEMDSLLRRRGIEAFLGWDYIGAPWDNGKVGNSGLCLRRRTAMVDTCRRSPPNQTLPNDLYFLHYLPRCGYRIAPFEVAREFSVEQVVAGNPLGLHAPYRYLPPAVVQHYLSTIRY